MATYTFKCKDCKKEWGKLTDKDMKYYTGQKRLPLPMCPSCRSNNIVIRSNDLLSGIFSI